MTATYHSLASGSFTQNWSDADLIIASDDWSGVASITGYRGDNRRPRSALSEGSRVRGRCLRSCR